MEEEEELRAEFVDGVWTVRALDGGRWWPDEQAEAEIDAASEPEAEALRICSQTPMRGVWKS